MTIRAPTKALPLTRVQVGVGKRLLSRRCCPDKVLALSRLTIGTERQFLIGTRREGRRLFTNTARGHEHAVHRPAWIKQGASSWTGSNL